MKYVVLLYLMQKHYLTCNLKYGNILDMRGEIMSNITTKLLKLFVGTLILLSSILCVFVTPNFEKSNSILSFNSSYKVVPGVSKSQNEVAMLDEYETTKVLDTFYGTITAYGPDCVGCSGITASGYRVAESVNGVITSITTTYMDEVYGELRVLAAATDKFPFGTVIRISGGRIDGYINGIVLDRGGAMNNAWANGKILIDLLFATEKSVEVYDFGRQNVTFEVLRYGN